MNKKIFRLIKIFLIFLILVLFSLNFNFVKNPIVMAQLQSSIAGGCNPEDLEDLVNELFDIMNEDEVQMGVSYYRMKTYEDAGYKMYNLHFLDQEPLVGK